MINPLLEKIAKEVNGTLKQTDYGFHIYLPYTFECHECNRPYLYINQNEYNVSGDKWRIGCNAPGEKRHDKRNCITNAWNKDNEKVYLPSSIIMTLTERNLTRVLNRVKEMIKEYNTFFDTVLYKWSNDEEYYNKLDTLKDGILKDNEDILKPNNNGLSGKVGNTYFDVRVNRDGLEFMRLDLTLEEARELMGILRRRLK